MFSEARYYSRMAIGIWQLLRTSPPRDPETLVRRQFENRETLFLDTVRQVVFTRQDHPYHRMFRLAGCEFGDLAAMARSRGLESTLARIRNEGIYLAHDEFKGQRPIVRAGCEIPSTAKSFENPLVTGWMEACSSGSRGRPVSTSQCTEYKVYKEAHAMLRTREFSLDRRAQIELRPILPATSGIGPCLRARRLGTRVERWFATEATRRASEHYRLATHAMMLLGNLCGAQAPYPVYLPPNDFSPVAGYIARRRAEGAACSLRGFASPLVRVAASALEKRLDISGTLFFTGGEPLTPGKREVIENAGAEVYPNYGTSEVGPIGESCRQIRTGNCVHVYEDSVAVIGYRRRAPLTEVEVDSLHFTTLLPFAPYVFINVEMDDTGVLSRPACDCVYSRLGLTLQAGAIGSFGKLTGQGVTLVGTDLVRILEEALPARLGGAPGDYQLVEQEEASQTQIHLRVNPRLGVSNPAQVRDVFLRLVRGCFGGSMAARLWAHSGGFEVVVAEPVATNTGKVHPLHLLGTGGRNGSPNGSTDAP